MTTHSSQQGFLLTRHWQDTRQGINVTFWLATDAGAQQLTLPHQQAVAFVPACYRAQVEPLIASLPNCSLRPLTLRDFHRRQVDGVYCARVAQLQQLEKQLTAQAIPLFEADIRPPERYHTGAVYHRSRVVRGRRLNAWADGRLVKAASQLPTNT